MELINQMRYSTLLHGTYPPTRNQSSHLEQIHTSALFLYFTTYQKKKGNLSVCLEKSSSEPNLQACLRSLAMIKIYEKNSEFQSRFNHINSERKVFRHNNFIASAKCNKENLLTSTDFYLICLTTNFQLI